MKKKSLKRINLKKIKKEKKARKDGCGSWWWRKQCGSKFRVECFQLPSLSSNSQTPLILLSTFLHDLPASLSQSQTPSSSINFPFFQLNHASPFLPISLYFQACLFSLSLLVILLFGFLSNYPRWDQSLSFFASTILNTMIICANMNSSVN